MSLRVAVIGPGAIGGLVAAALAQGGALVSLWGRSGRLGQLPPVRVAGAAWPALAADTSDAPPAVVVTAVKAHALADALQRAAELSVDAPLVPLVNGVPFWFLGRLGRAGLPERLQALDPDGRIAALARDRRVAGTVVNAAAHAADDGIHVAGGPAIQIEASREPRLIGLAGALRSGGLDVRHPPDITAAVWDKLMGNAVLNPLTALTGLTVGDAARSLAPHAERAMAEVKAVGRALRLEVGTDVGARVARAAGLAGHRTSMLQDLRVGRRTEIEALTGAVVELADHTGTPVPTLALLRDLVRALESGWARHE